MKNIIKSLISQTSSTDHSDLGLQEFQKIIGYKFQNESLLVTALTHTSREVNSENGSAFERMEFLGDSILGLIVSEELFLKFPKYSEGQLSKLKSKIVSRKLLALVSKKLKLSDYLVSNKDSLGKGGLNSVLSNTMESLICAIYLDGNLEKARKFIHKFILHDYSKNLLRGDLTDYKSKLQEYTQAKFQATPDYEILDSSGPEHDKIFTVQVLLNAETYGYGKGKNKKEAQRNAAKQACLKLKI